MQDQSSFLEKVRSTAAEASAANADLKTIAIASENRRWQSGEFQKFFLNGLFGELTGKTAAEGQDIDNAFFTPAAGAILMLVCRNQYWLWRTVGAAAAHAKSLPISPAAVMQGIQDLHNELNVEVARVCGAFSNGSESGKFQIKHLLEYFRKGILWTGDHLSNGALRLGLLLLEPEPEQKPSFWSKFPKAQTRYTATWNDLFDMAAFEQLSLEVAASTGK